MPVANPVLNFVGALFFFTGVVRLFSRGDTVFGYGALRANCLSRPIVTHYSLLTKLDMSPKTRPDRFLACVCVGICFCDCLSFIRCDAKHSKQPPVERFRNRAVSTFLGAGTAAHRALCCHATYGRGQVRWTVALTPLSLHL